MTVLIWYVCDRGHGAARVTAVLAKGAEIIHHSIGKPAV